MGSVDMAAALDIAANNVSEQVYRILHSSILSHKQAGKVRMI